MKDLTNTILPMKSKVSVVIPVYNGGDLIGETLDSVFSQTYDYYDVSVFDNCSTDDTVEVVKRYMDKYDHLALVCNENNSGLVSNWNRAILSATGDYIKLLCHDDLILPDHLECFVEVLDRNPDVSLVTSFEKLTGDLDTVRKIPILPAIGKLVGSLVQKHVLESGNWIGSPSSVLFRRKDLTVGLFDARFRSWALDYEMWLRLLAVGDLYVVPKILTRNRIHAGRQSSVGDRGLDFIQEEIKVMQNVFEYPYLYTNMGVFEMQNVREKYIKRLIDVGVSKKLSKEARKFGEECFGDEFRKEYRNYKFKQGYLYRRVKKFLKFIYFEPLNQKARKKYLYKLRKYGYVEKNQTVDIQWGSVMTYGYINFPIKDIYTPINTRSGRKLFNIKETPHYNWIKDLCACSDDSNSKGIYREYVVTFFPETDPDVQLAHVSELVDTFRKIKSIDEHIFAVSYQPIISSSGEDQLVLYDGVHRSSIAAALNLPFIKCKLLDRDPNLLEYNKSLFD